MNARQNVILNMWHAVSQSFNQFSNVIQSNSKFAETVNNFNQLHARLRDYGKEQTHSSVGVTMNKNNLRISLEKQGYVVAVNLKSWARKEGNHKIAEDMNFVKSYLADLTDTKLLNTMNLVAELASAHTAVIIPYGSTQAKVVDFYNTLESYKKAISSSRSATNNMSNATASIAALVAQGQEQLKEIDELIYNFEEDFPDFLTVYFKAREIIDLDRSHKKKDPQDPAAPGSTDTPAAPPAA